MNEELISYSFFLPIPSKQVGDNCGKPKGGFIPTRFHPLKAGRWGNLVTLGMVCWDCLRVLGVPQVLFL